MAKPSFIFSSAVEMSEGTDAHLRTGAQAVAASLFVALCAHITLPLFFTPVPLTLQPFAVLLVGLLLNPAVAGASLLLYLAEGAIGLPFFTPQGAGGVLQLFGATGGYLLSYPFAAFATSWLARHQNKTFQNVALAAAAGNSIILGCGAMWMFTLTHLPFRIIAAQTVWPFLPGDALKVLAAAGIATGFMRIHKRS